MWDNIKTSMSKNVTPTKWVTYLVDIHIFKEIFSKNEELTIL